MIRIIPDAAATAPGVGRVDSLSQRMEAMKNVLLLVHDDEGQEARFQAALDVTRAVEGHLICVDVVVYPHIAGDFYGASAMLLADEREREGANKNELERRLGHEGVPWDWHDDTGDIANCLTEAAGLADLIVVNRVKEGLLVSDVGHVVGDILLDSRTPILAVPEDARSLDIGGHAMVAWDGSEAANASLRAAVPLLMLADRVTIVTVDDGSLASSGEEAAVYLSRHGITPDIVPTLPLDGSAAPRLLMELRNRKPDYLVMGGFGHARLREALFGGVTRAMLTSSPVPLFLAR